MDYEPYGQSSIPGTITISFLFFFYISTSVGPTKYHSDLVIYFRRLRALAYGKYGNEYFSGQILVSVALTSRHQASGLPSLSSQQGEGFQDVFI